MCDFVIGYCGADAVGMSNWTSEKPLIENWRCVLRYLLDCFLLTMSVLLLWNWSSQAGRLPLTETHLKQPMPAAGGFWVKRIKPTVIMNLAGRVLNVHWSFEILCIKVSFVNVLEFGLWSQKKCIWMGQAVFSKQRVHDSVSHLSWEARRPERPPAGPSPSPVVAILGILATLISDVRAEILHLGKPAGRHFKHLGTTF